MRGSFMTIFGAAAALSLAAGTVQAQSGMDFYKGKTVIYIVATGAGGGYDYYGRLSADFMQRHMPGSTFVVKNMPGAGHLIGANSIYASKPDGLTLGTFSSGLIYSQLVNLDGVKFELNKMSWIGKAVSEPRAVMTDPKSPYKTLADMRAAKTPLNWSASGIGSTAYAESRLLIDMLKIPGKIIFGYSGPDELMAMRRGEIQSIIGSLSSFTSFINSGYGHLAFQIGGTAPPGVAQLRDLVKDDTAEAKAVVALIESQGDIQRFTVGPPAIVPDRLAALREAYRKAMEDPDLLAVAAKSSRPIEPAYGEDVAQLIRAALDQPPEVIKLVTSVIKEQK